MKITQSLSSVLPICLLLAAMFSAVGCSSSPTTDVAGNASQDEIDEYNRLIKEEAERVNQSVEKKDI